MKRGRFISQGDGNFGDKNNGAGNKVIRRTITVDDFVNKAINSFRAGIMLKGKGEVDFTSAMNMFAELGMYHFQNMSLDKVTDQESSIIYKYVTASEDLKIEATVDQWQDVFLKKHLMKLITLVMAESAKQAPAKGVSQ